MAGMNKFRAVKTELDGIVFASKKEASRYGELKMLMRSGYITNLQWQRRFHLTVNGVGVCDYIADFTYQDQQGREVVEDVKGLRSGAAYAVYRLKSKLMLACHGLRVIEL
jgi:hypothetical protein